MLGPPSEKDSISEVLYLARPRPSLPKPQWPWETLTAISKNLKQGAGSTSGVISPPRRCKARILGADFTLSLKLQVAYDLGGEEKGIRCLSLLVKTTVLSLVGTQPKNILPYTPVCVFTCVPMHRSQGQLWVSLLKLHPSTLSSERVSHWPGTHQVS